MNEIQSALYEIPLPICIGVSLLTGLVCLLGGICSGFHWGRLFESNYVVSLGAKRVEIKENQAKIAAIK